MANTPKVDMITSFSGGEFTPALAGHVDFEAYKSGSRFLENLIPEVQGGLKKFYGTREIAVLNSPSDYKMVPFDGQDEPIVLVFHDGIISVIDGDDYYDTGLNFDVYGLQRLTWAQQNSVIYFAHPDILPFAIRYLGRDEEEGKLQFGFDTTSFIDVPYFPIGWRGNFGGTITTNGETGSVRVEASTVASLTLKLPESFIGNAGQINVLRGEPVAVIRGKNPTIGTTTVQLIRRRNGVETVVLSVNSGVQHTIG